MNSRCTIVYFRKLARKLHTDTRFLMLVVRIARFQQHSQTIYISKSHKKTNPKKFGHWTRKMHFSVFIPQFLHWTQVNSGEHTFLVYLQSHRAIQNLNMKTDMNIRCTKPIHILMLIHCIASMPLIMQLNDVRM